jgi:hypothetical protein
MYRALALVLFVSTACGTYVPPLAGDDDVPDAGPDTMIDPLSDAGPDGGPPAMLAIDIGSNDYGNVLEGSESAAASFVISNHGSEASGAIATAIAGDHSGDFALGDDACAGAILEPEASCTVQALFAPGQLGDLDALLSVTADPGGEVTAALAGHALAPGAIIVDDDTHDYGQIKVAAQSAARPFTFSNSGDVDTGELAIDLSDPANFALGTDGCTGEVLAPGETCQVTVRFSPDAVGSATGSLTVTGDPGGNSVVALGGVGFAMVSVTRTGSGTGSVGSAPLGIECGATCALSFTTPSVTLSATAADGDNQFGGWSGDCTGTGDCLIDLDGGDVAVSALFHAMRTLTVSRTGNGGGTVTSAPGGIDCGTDCAHKYVNGTSVTLTATPAAGSLTSWTGCDSSTATTCTVAMTAARAVTATFTLQTFAVGVSKAGAGSGTVTSTPAGISCGGDCSESYNYGSTVSLSASAATGSSFASWTGCDSVSGATCTVSVTAARNVTATFDLQSFTLSAAKTGAGTGTISSVPGGISCGGDCSESYLYGTSVTLTATPGAGSSFGAWTGCDTTSGTTCTVTINGAESVSASFTLQSFAVTVNRTGGGTGTVTSSPAGITCGGDCTESLAYGTTVTLTAAPSSGSQFMAWTGCDSSSGLTCTVTVNGAETVGAAFELEGYSVGVNRTGTGTGTVTSSPAGITCGGDCSETFSFGTSVTLTATPAAGSTFGTWTGCDSVSSNTCTVLVNGVESVTASFTLSSHALQVNKSGTGDGSVSSSPAGISCGGDCSETYTYGTLVTLTATPVTGSVLADWTGCDTETGNTCTVSVNGAETVGVVFNATTPTLTVARSGNGSGSVSSAPAGITCGADCDQTYTYGTSVTLTATPSTGSYVSSWTGCDGVSGNTCTVSMVAAKSVGVVFTLTSHTVTVATGGTGSGTVTSSPAGISCPGSDCDASWNYGQSVTLTAAPAISSTFAGWVNCDSPIGNTCTQTVNGAENITANFTLKRHNLHVSSQGAGGGTVTSNPAGINCGADCDEEYDYGTEVTLTAAAWVGSTFQGFSGCDSTPSPTTCVVTINEVEGVAAQFTKNSYAFNVSKSGSAGSATTITSSPAGINCGADCSETIEHGVTVVLTAALPSNAYVDQWTGCTNSTSTTCTVNVDGIENVTMQATQYYYLSVNKHANNTGNGTVSVNGSVYCDSACGGHSEAWASGSSVTLTATPVSGTVFVGWSGGGCSGTGACTVTMNQGRSVQAIFNLTRTLYVSVSNDGTATGKITSSPAGINCGWGATDCQESYTATTTVTLTRPGNTACTEFVGWGGSCSGTGATCTVSVSGQRTVTAAFTGGCIGF